MKLQRNFSIESFQLDDLGPELFLWTAWAVAVRPLADSQITQTQLSCFLSTMLLQLSFFRPSNKFPAYEIISEVSNSSIRSPL